MLHRAAAATAKMCARRVNAPLPGFQPFDNSALASIASAGTQECADAIARHREGQKDRFAIVLGDSVPARPDPRYDELNGLLSHGFAVAFRSLSHGRADHTLTIENGEPKR